ncbi:hypothetical protein KY289_026142 [Solanum tuberosum]|nr:hypothetical protein KY289_026142 [Solanum tuberosum]
MARVGFEDTKGFGDGDMSWLFDRFLSVEDEDLKEQPMLSYYLPVGITVGIPTVVLHHHLKAEAIRKILGQDSNKKKQEKIKKQELAQEKAAKELAPNTIRTVMGPTVTVVTFPHDMGLPSIFDSKPCSYPPPREKCAGPSCVNPSNYLDPKSNLRLCSLKCYKAIHEKMKD